MTASPPPLPDPHVQALRDVREILEPMRGLDPRIEMVIERINAVLDLEAVAEALEEVKEIVDPLNTALDAIEELNK